MKHLTVLKTLVRRWLAKLTVVTSRLASTSKLYSELATSPIDFCKLAIK